jgi:hypothetical protein
MAHCQGEQPGTWVVAYVLQAGADTAAGQRLPVLEEVSLYAAAAAVQGHRGARTTTSSSNSSSSNSSSSNSSSNSSNSSSSSSEAQKRWMHLRRLSTLPKGVGAEAIIELLQRHVPELLVDAQTTTPGSSATRDRGGTSQVVSGPRSFVWTTHWLGGLGQESSSSSTQEPSWLLDMLQPAFAPHGATANGVLRMDDLLDGLGHAPPEARHRHQ